MNQAADFSAYPLPAALTRRVVGYLNLFRLFISLALAVAFFTGLLVKAYFLDTGAIAGTVLVSYFVIAIYLALERDVIEGTASLSPLIHSSSTSELPEPPPRSSPWQPAQFWS